MDGRHKPKHIDLTGQRFGRLVVIEFAGIGKHRQSLWKCQCDCGNLLIVSRAHLKQGNVTSCGCKNRDNLKKAGKRMAEKAHINGTQPGRLKPGNPPQRNNTSGVRGVSWHKGSGNWMAYITVKRKQIYLGRFSTIEEATNARKAAEEKYFKPILEKLKEE